MKEIQGIKLYDVQEVSQLMGVGANSIYSYINKGNLKSVKIGRNRYVSEEGLKEFLLGK